MKASELRRLLDEIPEGEDPVVFVHLSVMRGQFVRRVGLARLTDQALSEKFMAQATTVVEMPVGSVVLSGV
jgi:hypothetical protein